MEVLAKVVIISLYVSISNQYLVNNIICQLYLDNARKRIVKIKYHLHNFFLVIQIPLRWNSQHYNYRSLQANFKDNEWHSS